MNAMRPLRPVRWIGSSYRDFCSLPEAVRSDMGYALFVAQQGGKHRDAKPLKGFGGAGVVEIVSSNQGDTFRAVYTVRFGRVRAPRVPEEVQVGNRDAEGGFGPDCGAAEGSRAVGSRRMT
jgi:hypothetical protein